MLEEKIILNEEDLNGVILSPKDERDYTIDEAIDLPAGATVEEIQLPEEFEVWTPPVENQFGGTCVAHSISQIFEAINHNLGLAHRDYSIHFIYGNRRQKNDYKGAGMIPRYACANTVEYGDVLRDIWEYEGPSVATDRVIPAFEAIYPQISHLADLPFSKYVSLYRIKDIKTFIYKYKIPVMIVGPTSIFTGYESDGRHAVICYGWDKDDNLKFQNSWGNYYSHGVVSNNVVEECWGFVPKEISFDDIDIKATWGAEELGIAINKGILVGYPDRTFKPNNKITRQEMAVICGRIIKQLI